MHHYSMLIDTGPIVALFDKSEKQHEKIVTVVKLFDGVFVSTWPVIAEAMHLLRSSHRAQISLLKWIEAGGIRMFITENNFITRMLVLMDKYQDMPMDLADCSLIIAAEEMNISQIATLDSDFVVYKIKGKRPFKFVKI